MSDDGPVLRALFKGLCQFHGIVAWDEERAGPMPSDFYLPDGMGMYVVIAPEPQDRQAEIGALRQQQEKFVVLDREDLDAFRSCVTREHALRRIGYWASSGTHAEAVRRRAQIPGWE